MWSQLTANSPPEGPKAKFPCLFYPPSKYPLLHYIMAPHIPWCFHALLRLRYADRETENGQIASLHHPCCHKCSIHHHSLPGPWCSSLFTCLPASIFVPIVIHSPVSSKSESFETRRIMQLLAYDPPMVSHISKKKITCLQTSPASSHTILTFTPRLQNSIFFQFLVHTSSFLYRHMLFSLSVTSSPFLSTVATSPWLTFTFQVSAQISPLQRGLLWAPNLKMPPSSHENLYDITRCTSFTGLNLIMKPATV